MNLTDTPEIHLKKIFKHFNRELPSVEAIEIAKQKASSFQETVVKNVKSRIGEFPRYYCLMVLNPNELFQLISRIFSSSSNIIEWNTIEKRLDLQRKKGWHMTLLYRQSESNKQLLEFYDSSFTTLRPDGYAFKGSVQMMPSIIIWNRRLIAMIICKNWAPFIEFGIISLNLGSGMAAPHITLATLSDDVKPFESNKLIEEYFRDPMSINSLKVPDGTIIDSTLEGSLFDI
jgi:tRNA splicing ligase